MSRPDPAGCRECGRVECPYPFALKALTAKRADTREERKTHSDAAHRALQECGEHPRVNWQTEAAYWKREATKHGGGGSADG